MKYPCVSAHGYFFEKTKKVLTIEGWGGIL